MKLLRFAERSIGLGGLLEFGGVKALPSIIKQLNAGRIFECVVGGMRWSPFLVTIACGRL
jgi:hypothetical protein